MSQTKTLKITPTCFDHQMIIISEQLLALPDVLPTSHKGSCERMLPHNHT
jgi:hypothetical protein